MNPLKTGPNGLLAQFTMSSFSSVTEIALKSFIKKNARTKMTASIIGPAGKKKKKITSSIIGPAHV